MLSNYFLNTKELELNYLKYHSWLDLFNHWKINTENNADILFIFYFLVNRDIFDIYFDIKYVSDVS